MKKPILLIPTLLTIASTPLVSLVGCNEKKPTKYDFEFTGNNCKINGEDHFVTQIEENTKVEYTVVADSGFQLSDVQDLPSGVTLEGNLLTIEKMDKAYTVNINAVAIKALVIDGLAKDYQGTVGTPGSTGKITAFWIDGETKTDVTDLVTFDAPNTLTWDATNKCFSWSDELNYGRYDCSITASLSSGTTSDEYTTFLNINERKGSLICEGVTEGQKFTFGSEDGEISLDFICYDARIAKPSNVNSEVNVNVECDGLSDIVHWDGENGKLWWNGLHYGDHSITLNANYNDYAIKRTRFQIFITVP